MRVIKFSHLSERACSPMSCVPGFFRAIPEKLAEKSPSRLSGVKNPCSFFMHVEMSSYSLALRYKAGQKESQILNRIKQGDPDDKKHIVRLERTFEHRGHLCLVFESLRCVHRPLGSSLY